MSAWAKIKKCFESAVGEQVCDEPQWQLLSATLLRQNHFSIEDLRKLDQVKPTFPLTWENFLSLLSQVSMPQLLKDLLLTSCSLDAAVTHVQALTETWNPKSLSNIELAQLMDRLFLGEGLAEKSWAKLEDAKSKVCSYTEEAQRALYDRLLDIGDSFKTAHAFQEEEQVNIERQWFERRVRHVQYRNRAIKVLRQYNHGGAKVVGFCADKDTPLEVLKVPQTLYDFGFLSELYDTLDALKQLTLSKYFPDYLGFDDASEQGYCLYFFELHRGRNLRKHLAEARPGEKLLNYWIREILNAFTDLLHKCTHSLSHPVTLANIYTQDSGLKIYLRDLDFGPEREAANHLEFEASLLKMFGEIVLEMLTGDFNFRSFHSLDTPVGLSCILEESVLAPDRYLHAKLDHPPLEISSETTKRKVKQSNFTSNSFKSGLSLKRLQTHPFFEDYNYRMEQLVEDILLLEQ